MREREPTQWRQRAACLGVPCSLTSSGLIVPRLERWTINLGDPNPNNGEDASGIEKAWTIDSDY